MNLTKPELYDLVQALNSDYKLPSRNIAELIGKSQRQVQRILEDLGIKRANADDRVKDLPDKITSRCLRARR